MSTLLGKLLVAALVIVLLGGLGAMVALRLMERREVTAEDEGVLEVPVEVTPIERGAIEARRTFSGTLVPRARFIVAPKTGGRVVSLAVDVGDRVEAGDVVASLDDDEAVQAVAQAQAELEVARAELVQARSLLEIAQREYERVRTLLEREIASESAVDAVRADLRAKEAQVQVAEAQVQRAEAAVASERVRLGYTQVSATWSDGDDARVVAERFVDEGATVAANDPIVTVIDLSPVRAVMFVTEHDYARLEVGQPVTVRTDAYPNESFEGRVVRLWPVFEESSRQARVEVQVPNQDRRLKPGMYVRVSVRLARIEGASIVPEAAIVRREGQTGLFILEDGGDRVRYVPVTVGIVSGDRVQVTAGGEQALKGRVVTLGQHLLEDGSRVQVPDGPSGGPGDPGARGEPEAGG